MKKYFIALILILALPLLGSWSENETFLATAVDVDASDTVVITEAHKVNIGNASPVGITVIFKRAAGSASTVDFTFQVSYDAGNTWAWYDNTLQVATNTTAITGTTVRKTFQANAFGISHFKLYSIYNSDGANNVTDCNVVLSY